MRAQMILDRRLQLGECAFVELVLWALSRPVPGSAHRFKYRLAYVVDEVCVLRYDNETGKGDHVHRDGGEAKYVFSSPEALLSDFWKDVERWNDENGSP
jgi:hypothetical protein